MSAADVPESTALQGDPLIVLNSLSTSCPRQRQRTLQHSSRPRSAPVNASLVTATRGTPISVLVAEHSAGLIKSHRQLIAPTITCRRTFHRAVLRRRTVISRRKITSGKTALPVATCLRSAVSTGHVVVGRGEVAAGGGGGEDAPETRGLYVYTRRYARRAQCKLISFTAV